MLLARSVLIVLKLSEAADANVNGYEIDLDFCKGCGMCVAECPCGAIEMVPEKI
jgi:Pyruvate/2-oxoacid:ferredoxin oxidoreductase delta subunit